MIPDQEEKAPTVSTPAPAPIYRDADLNLLQEAFRRQVSGAHRVVEAFDKAKGVSQESLDYEVSL
jgi:hypothetical protein